MVSTIRFRSFKDLKLNWRTGAFIAVAIGSTAYVAMRYHPSVALVWLLTSYIVIGIVEAVFHIAQAIRHRGEPKADDEPPTRPSVP